MITADSPEAIEEVLWMHFFPDAHKPDRNHVMGEHESHPSFEKHYQNHIRKLVAVRNGQRYLAKNNYHVTRIEYLLKLFPDARFVIPIRDPMHQVASLMKQHRLFGQKNEEDSRVSQQLQLSGHFEFGPLRCPIIVDESRQAHYGKGLDEVAWYANQWADVYGFLQQRMKENQTLARACLIIPYEELCSRTRKSLHRLFVHLDINDKWAEEIIEACAPTINAPDYYQPDFSAAQLKLIQKLTGDTAESYNYG